MPARTLRCIGGPSHDRRIEFAAGVDEQPIINPIIEPTPDLVAVGSFKATLYIVRVMNTPDGQIEWASPVDMSTGDALKFALT